MEFQSKTDYDTGIYKITNLTTNKVYIGQTSINLIGRWKSHIIALNKKKHKNILLQRAWNKYGPEAFIATVEIYVVNEGDLQTFYDKLDIEERRTLLLYPKHYNLMEAGEDRMIFSEESKKRASVSAKNRKITEAELLLWEERRLIATRSEAARKKRSLAHKKIWATAEGRKKFEEAYKRPETFKKKSESIKKSWTKERREKQTTINKKMHANGIFKEHHRKAVANAHNEPGGFEKYSEAMKRGWKKRRLTLQTPEGKRKEKLRREKIKAAHLLRKVSKEN